MTEDGPDYVTEVEERTKADVSYYETSMIPVRVRQLEAGLVTLQERMEALLTTLEEAVVRLGQVEGRMGTGEPAHGGMTLTGPVGDEPRLDFSE